jgi:hypothetical protein
MITKIVAMGGRRKGSRNKFGGDLREAVVAGIQAVGFIEMVDGKPTATGLRGCQGFVEWLALHEPKTAAALFARVLPYFINVGGDVPEVVSEAEMEAMLKELGLPAGLIEHMQTAPAPLDLKFGGDLRESVVAGIQTLRRSRFSVRMVQAHRLFFVAACASGGVRLLQTLPFGRILTRIAGRCEVMRFSD